MRPLLDGEDVLQTELEQPWKDNKGAYGLRLVMRLVNQLVADPCGRVSGVSRNVDIQVLFFFS